MRILSPKTQIQFALFTLFTSILMLVSSTTYAENQLVSDKVSKMDNIQVLQVEKIAAFKASYPNVKVEIDSITGVPEELWGDLSKNQAKSDMIEAAYEFLEQNKDLYDLTNPHEELKYWWYSMDQNYYITAFRQWYKDIPIYESLINASFDQTYKLWGIIR